MRFIYAGKGLTVTEAMKDRAEKKIGKLEKFLPEGTEVHVTFIVNRHENKAEVTIPLRKRILRAEVVTDDMYTSIDAVVDSLEKQLKKYKDRLNQRYRKDAAFKEEWGYIGMQGSKESDPSEQVSHESENGIEIKKTKRVSVKPMDAEEAVMEMELLGHNFYVFKNGQTDEINVVYKRQDGAYGLIEPN